MKTKEDAFRKYSFQLRKFLFILTCMEKKEIGPRQAERAESLYRLTEGPESFYRGA